MVKSFLVGKGINFCGFIAGFIGEEFVFYVLENWFVVSVKSGKSQEIFIIPISGNPVSTRIKIFFFFHAGAFAYFRGPCAFATSVNRCKISKRVSTRIQRHCARVSPDACAYFTCGNRCGTNITT